MTGSDLGGAAATLFFFKCCRRKLGRELSEQARRERAPPDGEREHWGRSGPRGGARHAWAFPLPTSFALRLLVSAPQVDRLQPTASVQPLKGDTGKASAVRRRRPLVPRRRPTRVPLLALLPLGPRELLLPVPRLLFCTFVVIVGGGFDSARSALCLGCVLRLGLGDPLRSPRRLLRLGVLLRRPRLVLVLVVALLELLRLRLSLAVGDVGAVLRGRCGRGTRSLARLLLGALLLLCLEIRLALLLARFVGVGVGVPL